MALTSFTNFVFFYISLRLTVDGMEEFIIQPTAWYYARFLGQSDLFLGFLLSAFSFGALIFAPCFGALDLRIQSPKIILLMCGITKFIGNVLYAISFNGYFPLVGRFMSGIGEGTVGVVYGVVAQGTNNKNRALAFLYFEGLYSVGTTFGPLVGSLLTFKFDILSLKINDGNSPGLLLATIWFLLLILTMFLPNDLTGNNIEDGKKASTATKSSDESESESTLKDGKKDLSLSRICCLYFVIFQSWVLPNIVWFYTPLISVDRLGLGLVEIKLIYVIGALFAFLTFFGSYLFSDYFSEKLLIAIGLVTHVIPLSILFYFALSWNASADSRAIDNAYLLMVLMTMVNVSFVIFPLASSLLSKETPVNKASLYQSIAFTVLHLPKCTRVIAGATFNKTAMVYVCVGLTFGFFVELTWFLVEYRNLHPVSKRKNKVSHADFKVYRRRT